MLDSLVSPPSGSLEVLATAINIENSDRSLRFSLVIPTYNEGANVREMVQILSEILDSAIPGEYELIVVDDDSPDCTWKIAQELIPQYPQLRVMRRQGEKGLSTAVIRGWQVSRGEILGVIDGDLQHPPEILLQIWSEMVKGADLGIASRHLEGGGVSEWSIVRRFLSRGAQMLGLMILPEVISRLSDPMSGYFMVRRSAIVGKYLSPVGYKILIEVTARGAIRWIAEVGYVFRERQAGESKVTWKQYVEYLQHLLRLRFDLWPVKRFFRFGVVGFSGVFVDMIMLYLLSDPSTLGWGLTRSKILASEVAIVNNFLWNDAWTFADFSSQQKGWRKRLKRFFKFNVVCLAGLILNVLVLNFLFNLVFEDVPHGRYIANFIAIGTITFWNFWFNLKLSWRVTDAGK
jgi:dolichol-phosphate mannosyltransferase